MPDVQSVEEIAGRLIGLACKRPDQLAIACNRMATGRDQVTTALVIAYLSWTATERERKLIRTLDDATMAFEIYDRANRPVDVDDAPAYLVAVARILACAANRDEKTAQAVLGAFVKAHRDEFAKFLVTLVDLTHEEIHREGRGR